MSVCLGHLGKLLQEEGNLREDDGIPVLSGKMKIGSVRSEGGHIQQIICSHDSET